MTTAIYNYGQGYHYIYPTPAHPTSTQHFLSSSLSPATATLITRVQLQINLHTITDRVVGQTQRIMKRPLSLPLQHNLMHRPSNLGSNHQLEHLDRIARQTGNLRLGAQAVVDGDEDHGLRRACRRSSSSSGFIFPGLARLAVTVAAVARTAALPVIAAAVVVSVVSSAVVPAVISSVVSSRAVPAVEAVVAPPVVTVVVTAVAAAVAVVPVAVRALVVFPFQACVVLGLAGCGTASRRARAGSWTVCCAVCCGVCCGRGALRRGAGHFVKLEVDLVRFGLALFGEYVVVVAVLVARK
jgi:hypothetical protein